MKKTKKTIIICIAAIVCLATVLLIMFSSTIGLDINLIKHHDMQLNGFTLKFYGDLQNVRILKIYEGSIRRATLDLTVDKEIFEEANKFIPYFDDINGDGHQDLFVPHSIDEKYSFRYAVFMWDNSVSMFVTVEAIKNVANVKIDRENWILTSKTFEHKVLAEEQTNVPEVYEEIEQFCEYRFIDDVMVTYKELTLTYYSETDIYSYSIYEYNPETKELEYIDEHWLSPDKAKDITFS